MYLVYAPFQAAAEAYLRGVRVGLEDLAKKAAEAEKVRGAASAFVGTVKVLGVGATLFTNFAASAFASGSNNADTSKPAVALAVNKAAITFKTKASQSRRSKVSAQEAQGEGSEAARAAAALGEVYVLVFRGPGLGVGLKQSVASVDPLRRPVVTTEPPEGALPRCGHRIVSIGGTRLDASLLEGGSDGATMMTVAARLIKESPRPLEIAFEPPLGDGGDLRHRRSFVEGAEHAASETGEPAVVDDDNGDDNIMSGMFGRRFSLVASAAFQPVSFALGGTASAPGAAAAPKLAAAAPTKEVSTDAPNDAFVHTPTAKGSVEGSDTAKTKKMDSPTLLHEKSGVSVSLQARNLHDEWQRACGGGLEALVVSPVFAAHVAGLVALHSGALQAAAIRAMSTLPPHRAPTSAADDPMGPWEASTMALPINDAELLLQALTFGGIHGRANLAPVEDATRAKRCGRSVDLASLALLVAARAHYRVALAPEHAKAVAAKTKGNMMSKKAQQVAAEDKVFL